MRRIFLAAAVAAVAVPAMAFDLRVGQALSVEGHELGVEAIKFSHEIDEPATVEIALDILPFGTELDDAAHEAVSLSLCRRVAGERLEVLGIPVEAVEILLWVVMVDGSSTSRNGLWPVTC